MAGSIARGTDTSTVSRVSQLSVLEKVKIEGIHTSDLGQILVVRDERRVCVIVEVDHVVQAAEELFLR